MSLISMSDTIFRGNVRILGVAQEFAQQAMEVVHAALASGRIAPTGVEARAHAARHRLDDRLVLGLDAVEPGARAALELRLVPDERAEEHPGAVDRLRLD